MTFAVTDFKANLKQGGARPSLFMVELFYPQPLVAPPATPSKFLVKGASLPASTIGTYDVYYQGKACKVAGDRTFDTWECTIINDEDFGIRVVLEKWMNLIATHALNTRRGFSTAEGRQADYKQTIKVSQYGKDGDHKHHYHFYGAFPTALSSIALDWGSQDIEEYTVTWTYDDWLPGGKVPSPQSVSHHIFPADRHN
jgi:hypothetical protein